MPTKFGLFEIVELKTDRIGTRELCGIDDAGDAAVIDGARSFDENCSFDAIVGRAIRIIGK